jgi:ABC-type transporter Mla MlaB component
MIEQSATDSTVRLEGDVGISVAIELRGNLIEAISSGKEFKVELIGETAFDITTLQLLWAAERAAAKAGTKLLLSGSMPTVLKRAIELSGLEVFSVT